MAEKRGEPFCHELAEHHLLVGPDFNSFVCGRHFRAAVRKVGVTDHHPYRPGPCDIPRSEGGHWHYSTPDREGWCWTDEEEIRELVSAISGAATGDEP